MPEFSNLLRQRLGATEEARVHPDVDTLTAYAEQLLPAVERQQILTHLSACGQCREVIALSQAAVPEPAMQLVLKPAVSGWRKLFSPTFGMAAAAAVMAVVAVVVLQVQQKPAQFSSTQQAKVAPLPEQKVLDEKTDAEPKPAPPAQPDGVSSFSGQPPDQLSAGHARDEHRAPAVAQAQPVLTAGLKKQDFVNKAFFDSNNADVVMAGQNNNLPSAPPPKTMATATKFTANAAGEITSFSDIPPNATSNKSNLRVITPQPPPDHFGLSLNKIVIAGARSVFRRSPATTPAISSNSLGFSSMGSSKFSADLKGQPAEVAAAPEKSEAGALESTAGLKGRSIAAGTASMSPQAWKVVGGKLLKSAGSQWEDAYPVANFQFTVVNAHGSEVWAGGSQAALVHSRNGGDTWETSKLGDGASGMIVSIIFLGNNVQIKTSDDQSWSSPDGGKTWQQN
ncbi:MAG TPA: YCF48-related protein [Candidatus Sulfotelmatobacter sp.]|nr:YCF48-related protein [Candidatus Sulfotelmatobacter sp.]